MKTTIKIIALVACLTVALQARADVIVTNLDPVTAVYDGTNIATLAGGVPQPNLADGHAFNIEFTPTSADVTNTVLLMEIGGTANGTGLFLVNGVLAYLTKHNSGDQYIPDSLADTALRPDTSTHGEVAITNSFGPVSAGVDYTAAASWDQAGNLILAIQADSMATGRVDNITITGTNGNWSGDESISVGTNPRAGAGGPGGSVGGMAGEVAGNEFGEPFDVEDDQDTPIMKGFQGTIRRALYWNAVGQIGLFPTNVAVGLTWTNTASGAWGVAANWLPNTVPTAADSPKINNGGTAQIADGNNYDVDLLYLGVGAGNSGTLEISNGSLTVTNAPIDVGTGGGASATININGTGSYSIPGTMRMGSDGAVSTVNLSNGVFAAGFLRVGVDDSDTTSGGEGHFNVLGGTLYCTNDLNVGRDGELGFLTVNGGAVTNFNLSGSANDFLTIGGPGGTGTVSVVSGSVYTTTGVRMANGNPAQGTLNLNGGTLTTPQIFKGNANSTATVEFNGGTLRVLTNDVPLVASNANFTLNVNDGGAIIDTAGYDTAIELPLYASGLNVGGLTKNGDGMLSVYQANYGGPTTVNAGELNLGLPSSLYGAVTVADGAALGLTLNDGYGTMYTPSLTLGGAGATTLDFDFGGFPNPTQAPLQVGAVTANGTITVNVSGSALSVGQIPLISYTSLGGAGFSAFTKGTLPEGVTATLTDTGASIVLNITASGKNLTWNGASNGDWDTTTTNWINSDTTLPAIYAQSGGFGDRVTFDDSNFSGYTNINLALVVTPQIMTVASDSYDYSFNGAGRISGGGSMVKSGLGGLTLLTSNDYSGGTLISGGTVRMGNDAALGTGTITLAGPATLSSDGGTARTIANDIDYTADLTLGDPINNGTLTLAGNADLGSANRGLTINSDVIISGSLTNSVAGVGLTSIIGTGKLTVSASGLVDVAELFEQQADGGVVIDGGTFINREGYRLVAPQPNSTQLLLVTNGGYFAMNHIVGGTGNLVIGSSAVASDATSTNLIEVADGTVVSVVTNSTGGRILFSQNNGGALSAMNVRSNGTVICRLFLGQQGTSGRLSELHFYGGTIKPNWATEDNFISGMSGVYVHAGGVTFDTDGNSIGIPQPLLDGGGAGGLTKTGAGTMNLNGSNTYTGTTLVNGGTLGGIGSVAGPLVVASGGTFSPGTSIGAFTVNNSLTLNAGSQTLIEVDTGASPSNDVVNVTGTLTYGGVLTVTNVGTNALVAGDSFTVFPAGGVGAFSSVQGDAGPGLAFQFSDGVVSVVGAAAPRLDYLLSGNTITFTWSDPSYSLEAQTNPLSVGLSPVGWAPYSGGTTSGTVVTIDTTNPAVFFRLAK